MRTCKVHLFMTKSIRLFSILERLSKHGQVCVKDLALLYEVDVKTLQNDFKTIREYLSLLMYRE